MTKVKICGIREPGDAVAAAEAGADFIGLVFVPGRHRRLDWQAAAGITGAVRRLNSPTVPKVVGLFAGQPVDEVNRAIEACGLDMAQLCGQEPPEYCRKVNAPVIRVVHVAGSGSAEVSALADQATFYADAGFLVTLDRLVEGVQGGTGQSFDWDVAAKLARDGLSFMLAGGLSPDNVAQAVAQVRPWGVDVSSGVETGGVKDRVKIAAFIHRAKTAKVEERSR